MLFWLQHRKNGVSLFPPEFSRIDVRLQVAVNKLLRLNPNLLQACHFPNPRITKFIKIPRLLFFLITITTIMPLISEAVPFSCSPPGNNNIYKALCGNPANCALVDKGHNAVHFQRAHEKEFTSMTLEILCIPVTFTRNAVTFQVHCTFAIWFLYCSLTAVYLRGSSWRMPQNLSYCYCGSEKEKYLEPS